MSMMRASELWSEGGGGLLLDRWVWCQRNERRVVKLIEGAPIVALFYNVACSAELVRVCTKVAPCFQTDGKLKGLQNRLLTLLLPRQSSIQTCDVGDEQQSISSGWTHVERNRAEQQIFGSRSPIQRHTRAAPSRMFALLVESVSTHHTVFTEVITDVKRVWFRPVLSLSLPTAAPLRMYV